MTVRILRTFTGYPSESRDAEGNVVSGPRREFVAGATVNNLAAEYVALIVGKGLAEEVATATEPTTTE